jgi:hypothetical protein
MLRLEEIPIERNTMKALVLANIQYTAGEAPYIHFQPELFTMDKDITLSELRIFGL